MKGSLRLAGEANEVRANAEAGTLASRNADRRGDEVEHGENSRGDDGDGDNLLEVHALPGNEHGSETDGDTLNQILDGAIENFSEIHYLYWLVRNFLGAAVCVETP
jgi:hypothetical protein